MRISKNVALAAVLVGAASLAAPVPVQAATGYAVVRGAHLSPDTPSVDVYLTSFAGHTTTLWLTSIGYGDVSPYHRLKAGLYAVSMRPAGAPASSPVALRWTLDASAGDAFTAAAIGMNKDLQGIVLRDDLTPPKSGEGRLRVIQASSRAGVATVSALGGPVLAKSVAFGSTTPYVNVPAKSWSIRATADASPTVQVTSTVHVHSGTVDSIVVLDSLGSGITLRAIQDAAGAGVSPTGPVPAGGGGTAPELAARLSTPDWVGVVAALAIGFGILGLQRRRSARRG